MPTSRKRAKKGQKAQKAHTSNQHGAKKLPDSQIDILDFGENIIQQFLREDYINMDLEMEFYALSVYEEASEGCKPEEISSNHKENEFLIKYLSECEKRISNLFSNYDVYELTYWFRRIPPKNIFNNSRTSSVILRHEITTNAIYKHGKYNNFCEEERSKILPGGGLHPTSVIESFINKTPLTNHIINCLKSIFRSIVLSQLYLTATQEYRILNKGGQLEPTDNFFRYRITESDEIRHLLNLYDSRKATSLLAGSGVDTDPLETELRKENSLKLLTCFINVDNKLNLPKDIYKRSGLDVDKYKINNIKNHLNFFPAALHLEEVINYLRYFNDDTIKKTGFNIEDFAIFNITVSVQFALYLSSFPKMISILRRAYVTINGIKSYKEDFANMAKEAYKAYFKKDSSIPVDSLFEFFTIDENNAKNISLWTRGPRALIYNIGKDFHILDYLAVVDIIRFFGLEFSRQEGTAANYRSSRFENRLKLSLEENKFTIWIHSREIKKGKFFKKEVDSSFVFGEFLFLLEAKSINVSFGFDKGDLQAINHRIRELEKAIEQVESKADFLVKFSKDLNIPLPEGVKYIVPIVVSTWYEYIWCYNQYFFLDKEFFKPRILNLSDLQSLKSLDFDYLKTLSYIRTI